MLSCTLRQHATEVIMPRKSSVWFREQDQCWYTTINRRQHLVGEHPKGAPPPRKRKSGWNLPPQIEQAFHDLMAKKLSEPATPVSSRGRRRRWRTSSRSFWSGSRRSTRRTPTAGTASSSV